MKKYPFIIAIAIFIFSGLNSYGGKAPIKFGKVSIEELEMESYSPDPEAAAVVLCSYGSYDDENFTFTHVMRIKIFDREGFNLASKKFAVNAKSDVKGRTFNLENGEIVEDKLTRESVFLEKITDNYFLVNVAMPNVKEGSVIDLQIRYSGFPTSWYFQEDIPVRWSELTIEEPKYVDYRMNFFGYESLQTNQRNHWVAKEMPAFKTEPFMDSRENYITKFEFDIISIAIPGYLYEEYSVSWENLSERLMEAKYFGLMMNTGAYLGKIAKMINASATTDEEKVKAAVKFIHDHIEFNGKDRLTGDAQSLSTVYKEGIGNSAEINITLIRLLDKMDLQVYPVVLSTRDNGMLSPVFASIRRLNYVVAYVKVGEEFMIVDATDKSLPYYLLPEKCINWQGRLISEKKSEWVELTANHANKETVYYDLVLEEDLSLSGKLSYRKMDYGAYHFRKEMEKYTSREDYLEGLVEKHPDLEILDATIEGLEDIYAPVTEEYEVRLINQAFEMDNSVFLTLSLFEQLEENPFKTDERIYPVSLKSPVVKSGIVKIALPEHFSVEELPQSTRFVMPDNAGGFTYSVSHLNNMIMLNFKLTINKTTFLQNEYDFLKAFYNEVIKKEAEPLVLKINQPENVKNETGTY
jgi:hypothetical protein